MKPLHPDWELDPSCIHTVQERTGWYVCDHVDEVYDVFRFEDGEPPELELEPGYSDRYYLQAVLENWNAHRGAHPAVRWDAFIDRHQEILSALATLPRLGKLDQHGIDTVSEVVAKLEDFKPTRGRSMVFGSKTAHFHFPHLVPVMSSEVRRGLLMLEEEYGETIAKCVPGEGPRFTFDSRDEKARSYRNYIVLGNEVVRDLDSQAFLEGIAEAEYDLHAKIFEFWVITMGL